MTTDTPETPAILDAVPKSHAAEILHGQLVMHNRLLPEHDVAAGALIKHINAPSWIIIPEPELILGGNVVVPDFAGWRLGRLEPEGGDNRFTYTSPDWLCEVLTPSTEKSIKRDKRRIYAEHKVQFFWQLEPRLECLETYVLVGNAWGLEGTWFGDDLVNARPFFNRPLFPLSKIWPLDILSMPPSEPSVPTT